LKVFHVSLTVLKTD